jgi:hypothetical protein
MHRLLVLSADPARQGSDPSIELRRLDGTVTTYLLVGQVEQLIYYRRESITEEEARKLID